jgi:hypothetical protein
MWRFTMSSDGSIAALSQSICGSSDRLINCLDGLEGAQLNWRPEANESNSIYAIVSHALSAEERFILGRICGQEVDLPAGPAWAAEGDSAEPLRARWSGLKGRIQSALGTCSDADLDREVEHPRLGKMSGWSLLVLVDRHTAEHVGHVELTRDLLRASVPAQKS